MTNRKKNKNRKNIVLGPRRCFGPVSDDVLRVTSKRRKAEKILSDIEAKKAENYP